jgi:hypothetical protein
MEVHAGLAEMADLLRTAAGGYQRQDETSAAALSPEGEV